MNGAGRRRCQSWIESFLAFTDNLESPEIFRKWAAITTIAAALEQKVWITTSDRLYPNLYTFLVGHPGKGKTRTIMSGRKFLEGLRGFHIAPTSMRMASLVDALLASKRDIPLHRGPAMSFHSMTLLVDEWGTFMHKWDEEIVPGLTTFYDVVVPYTHHRRGKDIRIQIPSPQLTILAGSTPSNLMQFMPNFAWGQGFTSRIILIYSDEEKEPIDDFAQSKREPPPDMVHDIHWIFDKLRGEFRISKEYQEKAAAWRKGREDPKPDHPKLEHYAVRRRANLYKLSMISSVERSNAMILEEEDFDRALQWMMEVELVMPKIFEAGTATIDAQAMDEIEAWVRNYGKPVPLHEVYHYALRRLPSHSVRQAVEMMKLTRRLREDGADSKGNPYYLPG